MQPPFDARAPSFDAATIHDTIQRALASAGLDTTAGPMRGVTETIRRALEAGGMPAAVPDAEAQVVDVDARVIPAGDDARTPSQEAPPGRPAEAPGTFHTGHFSNRAGSRAYKLYVPARAPAAARPIVVMLHGCTQSADDFALGTQMNRLAEQHDFLVVYPEQSGQANVSRCWNWFQRQDQQRDAGEPSLIAGIVQEVAARHGGDPARVFVAGLSAGAAMAVVLGETYPDRFAGVGVHSGLPYGCADDVPSALAAMKGGRSGLRGARVAPQAVAQAHKRTGTQAVPTIVFHGDRDHTVQLTNGVEVVEQAKRAFLARADGGGLSADTERGTSTGGRSFSRTVYADGKGQARIEAWTLHGAGHAWSGGHPGGSFTDRRGPDASAEMVRFFLGLPAAATAG